MKHSLIILISILLLSSVLSNCAEKYAIPVEPEPPPRPKPENRSCSDTNYNKASKGSRLVLRRFLSDCGDMGHYNYKKAYSLLNQKSTLSQQTPMPKPENRSCSDANYNKASKGSRLVLRRFLSDCGDMGHYNYKKAYSLLNQKSTLSKPEPGSKVVLPKVTTSTPKVTNQSEKPQTIIIPTGSLGEMSKARIKILEKTLESKLDDHFAIVPKELFEEAREKAFEELEDDECTEDQCIMKIQEFLQVENAFKMELISEEGDTQISLTWNDQNQKRVEEDYCEGCKTKGLRLMIGGLVEKLVKGNN